MAKSLSRIQSQIEKLQKEADAMRSAAIARIRKEMAQLGLTAEDLFAVSPFAGKGRRTQRATVEAKAPKYADGTGNTWGGMGKRPTWLREALEAGRMLEEFLVSADAPAPASAAKRTRKKAAAPTKTVAAKRAAPARKPAAKKATAKRPARKKAASAVDEAPAAS